MSFVLCKFSDDGLSTSFFSVMRLNLVFWCERGREMGRNGERGWEEEDKGRDREGEKVRVELERGRGKE